MTTPTRTTARYYVASHRDVEFLLIGNPTNDLLFAQTQAEYMARLCPHLRYSVYDTEDDRHVYWPYDKEHAYGRRA